MDDKIKMMMPPKDGPVTRVDSQTAGYAADRLEKHPALINIYAFAETLIKSCVQIEHDKGLRIRNICDRLNHLLKK